MRRRTNRGDAVAGLRTLLRHVGIELTAEQEAAIRPLLTAGWQSWDEACAADGLKNQPDSYDPYRAEHLEPGLVVTPPRVEIIGPSREERIDRLAEALFAHNPHRCGPEDAFAAATRFVEAQDRRWLAKLVEGNGGQT